MISIFHGENLKESRQALNQLLDGLKNETVIRLEPKNLDLDKINLILHGQSLFTEKKTIFINNFFSISKPILDKIKTIFDHKSPTVDLIVWQDKKLTATQLKFFPQAKIYYFKPDETLFSCLYAIKPNHATTFLKQYHQMLQTDLFDLFVYFLKSHLRKQLLTFSQFPKAKLKQSYLNLIELEYQYKTGQLSLDRQIALERLLLNLIKTNI